MTNVWHDVSPGEKVPDEFRVIIEITKGSRNKYELDKKSGLIILDRVLYSPFHYPFDYGFIPQTLWEDGDPVDVMLLVHEPTIPGCIVEARPIGLLVMTDSGESDEKVLAVPVNDPRFNHVKDVDDIGSHLKKEIAHFFEHYKDLQGKKVDVKGWKSRAEALTVIKKGLKKYQDELVK